MRVAGGARRRRGARRGGPSPCTALGPQLERPEFPRWGGRCGRRPGSLQVTCGAAPAGPSWAKHAAERAELGAEWTRGPRCRRAPWFAGWPGPCGESPGGVGSGTAIATGVTGDAGSRRPGASSTRDKGIGVEGARSPCPRRGHGLPARPPPGGVVTQPAPAARTPPPAPRVRAPAAPGLGAPRHPAPGRQLAAAPAMAVRSLAAWPSALG